VILKPSKCFCGDITRYITLYNAGGLERRRRIACIVSIEDARPVSTLMRWVTRRADKPPRHVTSHSSQLSLLSFVGPEVSSGQSAVMLCVSVLVFCRPRSEGWSHHGRSLLSPFISVLCHSDCLFHGESCPRLDVVHPGRAWSLSPACTWHCSLHYYYYHAAFNAPCVGHKDDESQARMTNLFLQATPLFRHGVITVC